MMSLKHLSNSLGLCLAIAPIKNIMLSLNCTFTHVQNIPACEAIISPLNQAKVYRINTNHQNASHRVPCEQFDLQH